MRNMFKRRPLRSIRDHRAWISLVRWLQELIEALVIEPSRFRTMLIPDHTTSICLFCYTLSSFTFMFVMLMPLYSCIYIVWCHPYLIAYFLIPNSLLYCGYTSTLTHASRCIHLLDVLTLSGSTLYSMGHHNSNHCLYILSFSFGGCQILWPLHPHWYHSCNMIPSIDMCPSYVLYVPLNRHILPRT